MILYLIDIFFFLSFLFGVTLSLRMLFPFFWESFSYPKQPLNTGFSYLFYIVFFFCFFVEFINFYNIIVLWEPLQGFFLNKILYLNQYTKILSGFGSILITFVMFLLYFKQSFPIVYFKNLQVWYQQLIALKNKCQKIFYTQDIWATFTISLFIWTLIGGICYSPFYFAEVGIFQIQPVLDVHWETKFCPKNCSQCFNQIKDIEASYRWQEKYPTALMRFWNFYFHEKLTPDHYHIMDSLTYPPNFNGYGVNTPKGMINPGGFSSKDVWGDNPVVTPQTAVEFGPLENPVYFEELPKGAIGLELYPQHCSFCASEKAIIFNTTSVVEQAKIDYTKDILWKTFWTQQQDILKKANALHFHVWDLKKGIPEGFYGYKAFCPENLINPFGSTIEEVWGTKENVISFREYLVTREIPQKKNNFIIILLLKALGAFVNFYMICYIGFLLTSLVWYWFLWAIIIANNTEKFLTFFYGKPKTSFFTNQNEKKEKDS